MAKRYAIQADTEAECADGLRELLTLGLREWMRPRLVSDGRWMARAVPVAEAPAGDDLGRGPGVSG